MTPLILVHGYLGGSSQWSNLLPHLHHSPVYAVDLPGFGENNHLDPVSSIKEMATFVLNFASQNELFKFDLLGHSMGGMVAQEVAISYPKKVRKLVLYSTGSIGALPGRFETIDQSKSRITNEGAETAAERISATWFKELTDSPFHQACANLAKKANLKTMLHGLDAMKSWDRHNDLGRIDAETMIIWGTEDRTYNRAQIDLLSDRIKNSYLQIIPDTAHAIHDEKAPELAAILNGYLV